MLYLVFYLKVNFACIKKFDTPDLQNIKINKIVDIFNKTSFVLN